MLSSPNFKRATNKAYQLRLKYGVTSMFFDVFLPISIDEKLNCCKYSTFSYMTSTPMEEILRMGTSHDSFTVRNDKCSIVVYNDSVPESRIRYSIAHELGHILLKHETDDEFSEAEANCFARNLLSPVLYAQAAGIDFRHYPAVFGISETAARMAARYYDEDLANIWPSTREKIHQLLGIG